MARRSKSLTYVYAAAVVVLVASVLAPFAYANFLANDPTADVVFTADTIDAPTGLSCQYLTNTSLRLSWSATADTYADGHSISRKVDAGSYTDNYALTAPRATATYDDTVSATSSYTYKVRGTAFNWRGNFSSEIASSSCLGLVSTIGAPQTTTKINDPEGIHVQGTDLYIADTTNKKVKKVDLVNNTITTIAGDGSSTYSDGAIATETGIGAIEGVYADASGNVFIAGGTSARIYYIPAATNADGTNPWTQGRIYTIAGTGTGGIDAATCEPGPCAPAKNYKVDRPAGIVEASNGDVYFSDKLNNRLRKLVLNTATSPDQYGMTTVAGRSTNGTGEGSCATISNCQFNAPEGLAIDGADKIYLADRQNNRIRKFDPSGSGTLSTVAGTGTQAYNAAHDGGAATSANIDTPEGVAVEADCTSNCDIWVGDKGNNRVRKVYWNSGASRYDITTTAGTGSATYTGEGYPALSSTVQSIQGMAVSHDGVVYVSDTAHDMIRKIATGDGNVQYLLAATGQHSGGDVNGTTAWSVATVNPAGGAFDSSGNYYFADYGDNRIRMYERGSNILRTVAGTGSTGATNGATALTSDVTAPEGVAVYESGGTTYLYIADTGNNKVRKMTLGGTMTNYAGTGTACTVAPCGDGGAATSAKLNAPSDVVVDSSGNVFVSDTGTHTIRKIDTAGTPNITNFAGTLLSSGSTTTTLSSQKGLSINTSNNDIYIADNGNNLVRKVGSAGGAMTTVAGTTSGGSGNCSTNSTATSMIIGGVFDVAVTTTGTFYFVSVTDYRVCKVASGTASSVMGTGSSGTTGDGGAPGSAAIPVVRNLAVSSSFGMWLSQFNNANLRYVSGALP